MPRHLRALVAAFAVTWTACGPSRLPSVDEPCPWGDVEGGHPEPAAAEAVFAPRKTAWEAARGGQVAARAHVRARLAGWPERLAIDPGTLPTDDGAFLDRLATDTWRGLTAMVDREHHLPVDHVRLGAALRDGRVGDYTNVTTIGLYLIAVVAAHDLGLESPAAAVARAGDVLATLDRLENVDGLFYNYYDTTTLERTSNLLSFVDSAWLAAGLIVVRQTFPTLAPVCDRLLARTDFRRFYDDTRGQMTHGYWVQRGVRSQYHYGMLYAEARLGSVLAIGAGQVPAEHWFRMVRTPPASCQWQTQAPQRRIHKTELGTTFTGGWYVWNGVRFVPSWGGSMFEALMPTLVLDEERWAPASLGANGRAHVEVQRRFATGTLGWGVWGLSPSAVPGATAYGEYGVRPLGVLGYRAGAVTPHASALALAVAPAEATANLRRLAAIAGLYGDWGLYDAVRPETGAVSRTYLALDQAMTLVALANHRTGGRIPARFAADPRVAPALAVLGMERFFETP